MFPALFLILFREVDSSIGLFIFFSNHSYSTIGQYLDFQLLYLVLINDGCFGVGDIDLTFFGGLTFFGSLTRELFHLVYAAFIMING